MRIAKIGFWYEKNRLGLCSQAGWCFWYWKKKLRFE